MRLSIILILFYSAIRCLIKFSGALLVLIFSIAEGLIATKKIYRTTTRFACDVSKTLFSVFRRLNDQKLICKIHYSTFQTEFQQKKTKDIRRQNKIIFKKFIFLAHL